MSVRPTQIVNFFVCLAKCHATLIRPNSWKVSHLFGPGFTIATCIYLYFVILFSLSEKLGDLETHTCTVLP